MLITEYNTFNIIDEAKLKHQLSKYREYLLKCNVKTSYPEITCLEKIIPWSGCYIIGYYKEILYKCSDKKYITSTYNGWWKSSYITFEDVFFMVPKYKCHKIKIEMVTEWIEQGIWFDMEKWIKQKLEKVK